MSENLAPSLIDTSDMIQLHQVFRDAFGAAAPLVGSVATGDLARAEVVGTFYANVLELLKAHHEGEDELVWPKLLDRAPEHAETVRRVAGQHDGVTVSLGNAKSLLAGWCAEPGVESGAQLAVALATLGADLAQHLDEEERVILPLAAVHLTAAEWAELPAHGMQRFAGDKPWLVLGLIQEQMRPEQVEAMESHMPPPVADFWTTAGRPQFRDFVAELRH